MNTNDMISKIKEVLNLSQEVKLEQQALENGTVLEAEAFEAGNEVFIITEDEKIAVPVGEYELEDGRILVVAEEGLISEIKTEEAEEETEEVEVEAAEEEKEEMKYATKEELESAIAEMKAMYEAIVEKMGSEEMETEVPTEELAKEELSAQEPAGEPITHSPEVESAAKPQFFSGMKPRNTMSVVYEKMFNK